MRQRAVLSLSLIALLAISACRREHSTEIARAPVATPITTYEACLPDNIKSLDPATISDVLTMRVGSQIYEGLVGYSTDHKVVPALAASWSTQDGRTWRFALREDARFADDASFPGGKGRPVTATDVKYSFERVLKKETGSPGGWIFQIVDGADDYAAGTVPDVRGLIAVDPKTIEIRLRRPYYPFLYRLLTNFAWVVPREAVEKYGQDFATHPVGSGPYRLSAISQDDRVTLVRNGIARGMIGTLRFRILKNDAVALREFLRGGLHEIVVPPDQVSQILDRGTGRLRPQFAEYQLISRPGLNWYFIGIHAKHPVLGGSTEKARLLRQAIQSAINKQAIVNDVLARGADPLNRLYPAAVPLPNPDVPPLTYDPARARRFLAQAGYSDDVRVPPIEFAALNTQESRLVMAQIQSDLSRVGIESSFKAYDFPTLVQLIFGGGSHATSLFIDAIDPHPEYFLQFFLSSNPFNFFGYSNPGVDQAFERTFGLKTDEERNRAYAAIENDILNDSPWILLYTKRFNLLLDPRIGGVQVDGLNQVRYRALAEKR